jgi:predicted dehydrogenase
MDGTWTRREFLERTLGTAAAAFAVGLGERLAEAQGAPPPTEGEPFRFAIIGSGNQGRNLMRNALRIPGVEFVAVCDIFPPHREAGLKLAGPRARSYEDYRRMLEREARNIDAILVATPLSAHAPIVMDCLEAGFHVFCEKALARTIEQCQQVVRTAKRTGRKLQVGHQRRYNPIYHHALELIKKGTIGRIIHIRALWHRNHPWRRAVPKVDFDPRPWGYPDLEHLINWRLYWKTSAGLMTELASHQLDVVSWFLDAHPLSVVGTGGVDYWKDGREVWDNVEVVYEYPGGVKVMYSSITANQHDGYYEQFMGDKGTIILTQERRGLLFLEPKAEVEWAKFAKKEGKAVVLDTKATTRKDKPKVPNTDLTLDQAQGKSAYQLELEAFIQAIRSNQEPFCNGVVGQQSAVEVLVANEAIRRGEKIEFKEEWFRA